MVRYKSSFWLCSLLFCSQLFSAMPECKTDVVILGGGIGGLTSAIYLARGGVPPLVIEGNHPGGAIVRSKNVQNWPGDFEISGAELVDKIRAQAEKNGAILLQEEVIQADFSSRPFSVIVQDIYDPTKQRKIVADACIIATGTKHRSLGIMGESKYESNGIYTCAFCDGPLYKDKVVGVIGGGDGAVLEAEYLSGVAKKVYVLVRGDHIKGIETVRKDALLQRDNVEVMYGINVVGLLESEDALKGIMIEDSNQGQIELRADAIFLALGSIPNTNFFANQIELDDQGYIVCKNHLETSVPGVFAVGDVTDPIFKQAVTAGGEGAKAAIQAQRYLVSQKKNPRPVPVQGSSSRSMIEVANLEELQGILKSATTTVLVDFYSPTCPPCRGLSSFLDRSAQELEGRVLVCKVNLESGREIFGAYGVKSMPTVVHVDSSGKEIARRVGPPEITKYINGLKR